MLVAPLVAVDFKQLRLQLCIGAPGPTERQNLVCRIDEALTHYNLDGVTQQSNFPAGTAMPEGIVLVVCGVTNFDLARRILAILTP